MNPRLFLPIAGLGGLRKTADGTGSRIGTWLMWIRIDGLRIFAPMGSRNAGDISFMLILCQMQALLCSGKASMSELVVRTSGSLSAAIGSYGCPWRLRVGSLTSASHSIIIGSTTQPSEVRSYRQGGEPRNPSRWYVGCWSE